MIETEKSRKNFMKQTGRTNLGTGLMSEQTGLLSQQVPCPLCEERRRKKAEAMKRYRNKKGVK